MAEKWQFRNTHSFQAKGVSPAAVGAELMTLHASGPLTPSRVVTAAESVDSAIHPMLEWDDAVAGHEFRLTQARSIIRSVVIIRSAPEGEKNESVTVFVHIPKQNGSEGRYVTIQSATHDPDEYERALREAQQDLMAAKRRFEELRRLTEGRGGHTEAIAIAIQGFSAVSDALAILRREAEAAKTT